MFSQESHVMSNSDYYVYTPSITAKKLFFYPIYIGSFQYEANYHLNRTNYDSFLIMLVTEGSCDVCLNGQHYTADKGSIVFIDCYAPHQYGSSKEWSALWLHFDGPMAREYYNYIMQKWDNVFVPPNFQTVKYILEKIYKSFKTGEPISEPDVSVQITQILNSLLSTELIGSSHASPAILKDAITYINEHFAEPVHLDAIAEKAALSPFYFTRLFAKETGMTPYHYLIATRISAAKFLLKSTSFSVKEIAFRSGFSSESSFCSAFKKYEHMTPTSYRNHTSEK